MTLKLNGTNSEAAPAYAGDDADTGLQCGTDELKLVTGGTARATIDSSGNVGIGTTSAGAVVSGMPTLHLASATAGRSGAIRWKNTGETNKAAAYWFGTEFQIGTETSHPLKFTTGDTERMRILTDGTIRLASGCPGIDFSQIQTNVSGMTSETLDSYEEGAWTPSTTASSGTITSFHGQAGRYTKIGRTVYVTFAVHINNVGTANGAYLTVSGFPFASHGTSMIQQGTVREQSVNGFISNVNLGPNATAAGLHRYDNGGIAISGGNFHGSITYDIA